MYENIALPPQLEKIIGSESKEFTVKGKRANPPKTTIFLMLFGMALLAFTSIVVVAFLGLLFQGKEVEFLVNDVPAVVGPGNLGPITLPAMMIGLFVLVGLAMFGSGIYLMFKKGGYRLIHC